MRRWERLPSSQKPSPLGKVPEGRMRSTTANTAIMSNKIVYNESLKPHAQRLRREMTRQERHLWYDFLRSYSVSFRRQKSFSNYIVDFYCAAAKLVVEIDGSQHYEPGGRENDEKRDRYLNGLGLRVMRFSNFEVDCQFEGVCAQIDGEVTRRRGQSEE